MPQDDIDIIGKNVKDMYGTFMGKVIGTMTDIDGSIQTVGVDCGSQGLQQIQFDQLVSQGDVVIFIPKWRLDSQRLIREKQLTLRRLKALIDIVSDNDDMKEDAEIIHEKYKSKLVSLDETERQIKAILESRLGELDEQLKSAKMLVFDAKLQHKSDEISSTTFETVKTCTTQLIEHITHETSEISNVQKRITDLNVEAQNAAAPSQQILQDSAVTYLDTSEQPQNAQSILPEAPKNEPITSPFNSHIEAGALPPVPETPAEPEVATPFTAPPQQVTPETSKDNPNDNDWLARMEAS
ncbi:MAG: CdvA-like protein [Nitrosopumilus sp.]|nr:CdvA-like protein [Nitrosopumilus sp.]MDH3385766.1 CdvA-like protein [Nitrosopumilus sp.]